MRVLTCRMKAPVSMREAFAVFESPYNLARITPPWLHFRITTPRQVLMRKGAEIEYRIRWLGLPIQWKTIITEYDAPRMFEDNKRVARTNSGAIATRLKKRTGTP
jgi:ligand-binding SRPBCC domain-containing protein